MRTKYTSSKVHLLCHAVLGEGHDERLFGYSSSLLILKAALFFCALQLCLKSSQLTHPNLK